MKNLKAVTVLILAVIVSACAPTGFKKHDAGDYWALEALEGADAGALARQLYGEPALGGHLLQENGLDSIKAGQAMAAAKKIPNPGGLYHNGYRSVPVLSYHNFSARKTNRMTVTKAEFEAQLKYLKDNGYTVISLDRLYEFLSYEVPVPVKSVVITIDDGWQSFYLIAWPLLKKYGYPATLFVYTDLIGLSNKTLTWKQVREIQKGGLIDIEGHTKSHSDLSDAEEYKSIEEYLEFLDRELVRSREKIEKETGRKVRYLAYPYGETSRFVKAVVSKAGYRAAFTVERGSTPFFIDPLEIDRRMIYGGYSLKRFVRNLDVFDAEAMK